MTIVPVNDRYLRYKCEFRGIQFMGHNRHHVICNVLNYLYQTEKAANDE